VLLKFSSQSGHQHGANLDSEEQESLLSERFIQKALSLLLKSPREAMQQGTVTEYVETSSSNNSTSKDPATQADLSKTRKTSTKHKKE